LFSQNKKVLEILFEEYKCPQLLICSQALINLISFNQTSGTVVDLGESGTQISSIIDGYTQYYDSVYNSFLSGRNLNLLYYYEKFNTNKKNNNNNNNLKPELMILKIFRTF
jgi:actin-related protein